jgi:hypothetical protein
VSPTHIIPALLCDRTTAGKVDKSRPQRPKLVGYYIKGKTPNWTRMKEYHAWKDHMRGHVPGPLPEPTKAQPVRVDVWCFFENGTHNDPEKVRKGSSMRYFRRGTSTSMATTTARSTTPRTRVWC